MKIVKRHWWPVQGLTLRQSQGLIEEKSWEVHWENVKTEGVKWKFSYEETSSYGNNKVLSMPAIGSVHVVFHASILQLVENQGNLILVCHWSRRGKSCIVIKLLDFQWTNTLEQYENHMISSVSIFEDKEINMNNPDCQLLGSE